MAGSLVWHSCPSDKKISNNRFLCNNSDDGDYAISTGEFCSSILSTYLHREDSVDGESAPLAEVPCFLPVVPRMTSCKPALFQQIEYLTIKAHRNI